MGVLLFWPLSALGLPLYLTTAFGAIALGIWAADRMGARWATVDDRRIVIDEIVGQLLTLAPLLSLARARSPGWVVTGFVLFRLYDIWKPGPVRWLEENLHGGVGVVLDDVLAGALGALTLVALAWAAG